VLVGDCGRTLGKYGTLECKFIIHAVGPIYDQFTPKVAENLLISAVINTLEKAKEFGVESISIPAISSGIFGFPKDDCAYIMQSFCAKWAASEDTGSVKSIRLCNFDAPTCLTF